MSLVQNDPFTFSLATPFFSQEWLVDCIFAFALNAVVDELLRLSMPEQQNDKNCHSVGL